MNIVVDTNIVFSAIWNTIGRIANILLKKTSLNFYSLTFLLFELTSHQEKLHNRLNISPEHFLELKHLTTRRIRFIDEEQISAQNWKKADQFTKGIDSDDIAFVALALELKCPLWTGDKRLSKSISELEIYNTSNIDEILRGIS